MHPSGFQRRQMHTQVAIFLLLRGLAIFVKKGPARPVSKMQRTRKEAEKKVVRIWVFGGASPCDWLEGFFAYFWLASIFLS